MLLSEMTNKKIKIPETINLFEDNAIKEELDNSIINLSEAQIQMLSEEYFGKSDNLKKIDACFDEILELAKRNTNIDLIKYANISEKGFYKESSVILLKICEYIEKEFNFKNVAITILNTGHNNAFTVKMKDVRKRTSIMQCNTEVSSNGIHFKEKTYSMNAFLDRAIFDTGAMTGRHLTAVLLHEIGHQFYFENTFSYRYSVRFYLEEILNIMTNPAHITIKGIGTFKLTFTDRILTTVFSKKIREKLFTSQYYDMVARGFKSLNALDSGTSKYIYGMLCNINEAMESSNRLYKVIKTIGSGYLMLPIRGNVARIKNVSNVLVRNERITEEQFCDNFATSYGYGNSFVEAISAITTLPNSIIGKTMESNMFTATLYNSYYDLDTMIFGQSGIHPTSLTRIIDQISYIETQLASNKTHPLYDQMVTELSDMKKSYKSIQIKVATFEKGSDAMTRGKVFATITNTIKIAMGGDLSYQANSKAYDKSGNLNAFKR